MAAEVSADLNLIQDEDVLRRMWADTEDFGKKKEIRARMYKLREQRLKDFYTTGEVVTEITGRKHLTTTHAESIGDQGFMSMKSKEIRDSESPTRDLNRQVVTRQGNNGYWNTEEERGFTSGNQDGVFVQVRNQTKRGEGLIVEGDTQTKIATAAQNVHEVQEKADDNSTMKAEKVVQSQAMASSSVTNSGDSTTESAEQRSSKSSKEEKVTHSSSQMSNVTSSSTSKKVVSSSSTSSSKTYVITSSGERKLVSEDIKVLPAVESVQSSHHESNLKSKVSQTSVIDQSHRDERYSQSNVSDVQMKEISSNNQRGSVADTAITDYDTSKENKHIRNSEETSSTRRTSQESSKFVNTERQRISVQNQTLDSANVDDQYSRQSNVSLENNVLNKTLRNTDDTRNQSNQRNVINESKEIITSERISSSDTTDDSFLKSQRPERVKSAEPNAVKFPEKTTNETITKHEIRSTGHLEDSTKEIFNKNESKTNQQILTEIQKLDTYLHDQHPTPAHSEPVTPKTATDNVKWTVVSKKDGEFVYHDEKAPFDGRPKDDYPRHDYQAREPQVKHPTSLDLRNDATDGQYVTTYAESYNRVSMDNSPSHQYFMTTLRASPASPTSGRLTPSSPTKSSRNSLDRASPERRVRPSSRGSQDRGSPSYQDRRSPDKGTRASPVQRRGSSDSYVVDKRKNSRRKTTEISQSTVKDSVSSKPKRKFSSTQQKAANKARASTPGASPSTSPTRSSRKKETTSGSESDVSNATYNKTTSTQDVSITKENESIIALKKQTQEITTTRDREKSPEYSSEGSISREINKSKIHPTPIPSIHENSAFRPIKPKEETIQDNRQFITEEQNYTVEEQESIEKLPHSVNETVTITEIQDNDTNQRDLVQEEVPGNLSITTTTVISTEVSAHSKSKEQKPRKPSTTSPDRKRKTPDSPYSSPDRQSPKQRSVPERQPSSQGSSPERQVKKPTGTGTTRTRGSDQPKETRPQMSPTRTMEKEPRRMPTSSPEREVLTSKRTESTRLSSSDRVRSASSSPSPTRRTDIHTKSVTSRSLVTEESRTPRPHQSPMSSPTRRRTDNETTKIERKTTDRVSTIRNRTPVSPKSKLPEPKREPLSSTQTKRTAKTTTTSQKTSQTSRIQPTSAATSKPLSPRKPNEHTLTTKTTTMTTTRSSSVPKQQLSTRTTKTVTRTGSRPEERKPTSPTKASTSRRPVEPSTPVQPRGRPQVPRSQLIETPKRTTPKTSSVRTTTTTVTLQKTRPSKIPAQSPSPVKGKPTNANQKEVKPKDSVVNINNEFITEERRQVTDLEDEYPPDEFYADYDDSSPERMPQTGTTKSPVKTKVTSSSTTIRKTATNEVNNKKISKKHKKEKKHTKSTDSSSSSSDDEIDAADQTAELSRQERDVNHTINQDLLNVVVQHPKSSRESSPGYPSAGVPFCSTSEDGESNPRYADFVSEPEDVEVFDKHRGPPSAPIQLSEEPNAPVPSVADRVNVFLENTRNLETVTKKDTLITSKPKSVLKKTELFENIARNQTLSTETKTTEDINITSVEEVDINDEIIENKIDSTFDKQPSTLKPDKETLRNVDTSSREITEITEIENMSDSRQLIENEIGKADIDYEITRVRIDKHDKPTVRGSDDVSPGKKPFERRPSGTAGDVSSKKTFFERKVKDTTTPGAKGREPKQGTARDSYETVDRKKSESSYVKSTTSSVISSKTERSPVKSTDLSPERPTNKRKSSKPEEITRKPSKGEDAMRKTSRPERTSPERRISQPDEIARKPSSPERRPVKLDDITNKQHRPGGFSPERKPSKPEEIHRRPSKPEEPKKSPSRPQEIHRKPTPTVPLEITKRPTKSEDVAKKVSKFENVTSTDSYSKTPKQPVSERPKSRHSIDRTDSSYMRSTVVSSVRSHTPESELPKDSRRTPSQESRHPSSKDTRSESYMRGTVASTVRSHTPDHQVPEEIRRRPSHDDDHLRPGEETDNLDQTRETRTESYMRSTVASSVRTHTPDQQAPGSVRRGSLNKEIPRGSDGRDSPDRGREHFMENTESSILRTVSPDRVHKEDSRSFILSERRSSATEETTRVTSSRTSEARRTEDRTSGKFGVTLRKTPSATKMTPSTKSKPTTSRQSSRTSDEVEDIFDLELLEEMLLKATGYDDRRRIRAQIRIVKKQIEEEKNAGFLSRTTTKTTTTSTTYSSDKQSPIPSTKDIKNLISGDRPVQRSPEQRRPTSSSFDRKGSSPERKYTSPERKVTSPERKVSSPERKFTSPERKASSPERKFTSPERKALSPERKFTSPERKVSSPERKVTSPERKPTGERRQVSPDRRSPERSPNRRSSQDKSSKVYYETSTTVRSQSVKRPSIGESPTDIITSSYGVGPTDENGRPLFGLKALRRTSTTKTLLDEKEVYEKTVENKEESSSLFGLRALQSETTTMPAESSQLKELVERHQQYVRENSSKDLQPRQKPKAKLRDSFILSQEDEAPLIQTPDDKSLSLKSIIKTEDGKTVRSSMESRSTVIKSHSSFSSDGKVSLHRDVIHGEVSSKNGEEPSGKITRSSYSYQSPNDKETPSIKSSTTTQVIGGRRGSGPRIEEITDSSHTTSNETNRRFSKEYTVEEEETVSERRRSSGVSVGESVKKYTSILKNSNQENLDSGRRASGPRITEILSSDRDEKLSSSTRRDSSSTSADVIDSKTSFSNVKSTEEKSDLSKKVITRGDSVKALQHKFQQATEAANQPPARTYPRAGLILRSNTRPQIDDQSQMSSSLKTSSVERSDSKSKVQETVRETKTEESRTSPTGRGKVTSQSTVVTTTKVSRSEEPTSFLDNRSKVTGVQDILSRMRNADLVSEQTDTAEDAEARALLNKFLGASVILQGMEQGMKSAQHTSSNLREERRQIVSETEVSARSPASAALVREVEKQRVKATSALTGEDDFDDINDEKQIRILLDGCSDYENRRKLRARLRTIMAEQKGGTDDGEESQECIESSSSQVVKDGNSIVKTEVHTRTTSSSAKLTKANSVQSPFAKFRQLERQNSAPSAGHPPPLFKFTEPKLALSASTIKERLLRWAQAQTQSYKNIQIENFSTSWSNGLAFCALIHHFCPHAFDYNTLTAEKRRYNFELAFRVAEEEADIFPLLDVEDMVTMRKPDWKCVFTYVQSIYRRFHDSPDALPVSY